jgi:hypothetical protein
VRLSEVRVLVVVLGIPTIAFVDDLRVDTVFSAERVQEIAVVNVQGQPKCIRVFAHFLAKRFFQLLGQLCCLSVDPVVSRVEADFLPLELGADSAPVYSTNPTGPLGVQRILYFLHVLNRCTRREGKGCCSVDREV